MNNNKKPLHKILCIENDGKLALKIKNWLMDSAELILAPDRATGIAMAQTNIWSLIIVDIDPLGVKGLHIIEDIKKVNMHAAILILADHKAMERLLHELPYHEPVDGFLFKPIKKTTFTNLTNKLAQNSHLRRQKEQKIVLAIGAHPDDVEIGCGGALARHQAQGDALHILTLSSGSCGGNANIRKKESQLAAQYLKANLFIKDLDDTYITGDAKTIALIEKTIEQVKPTHVYTHSLHDDHQDHRNVHLASVVACRSVPNLYCYQSPSSTIDFKPTLFIEISEHIEHKMNALACYKSQTNNRSYLQKEMIHAAARYWGRFARYGLAEPMEVMRQHYH